MRKLLVILAVNTVFVAGLLASLGGTPTLALFPGHLPMPAPMSALSFTAVVTPTWDLREPNNDFATATDVTVDGDYTGLNFVPYSAGPAPDVDYYKVLSKPGREYQATVSVVPGLDTYMELYNAAFQLVAANDDIAHNNYGSQLKWTVGADTWYYLRVSYKYPLSPSLEVLASLPYTLTIKNLESGDRFEPNNVVEQATEIWPGIYRDLSFAPTGDVDYYRVWHQGFKSTYELEIQGATAKVAVNGPVASLPYSNPGDPVTSLKSDSATRIWTWTVSEPGWYTIRVDKGATETEYTLILTLRSQLLCLEGQEGSPYTFEPNHDFEHAATIELGKTYSGLNFASCDGYSEDNDFFRLRVKPNLLVTCQTTVTGGTDTNMIFYKDSQAQDCGTRPVETCQGLAGNDDIDAARGNLGSKISYVTNYDGWLYILVGQGRPVPPGKGADYKYDFGCISPGSADRFEPNDNFEQATIITENKLYPELNFVSNTLTDQDADYFKLQVRRGLLMTCTTTVDPESEANTLLTFYNAQRIPIGAAYPMENPLARNTVALIFTTYDGWIYIQARNKYEIPLQRVEHYKYALKCDLALPPPLPTPTPIPIPTFTPTPTLTVTETPKPSPEPSKEPDSPDNNETAPRRTPTPASTSIQPDPKPTRTLTVRIFYDHIADHQPNHGEGVSEMQVWVDDYTEEQRMGFTDNHGVVTFTVSDSEVVLVRVPYLNLVVPVQPAVLELKIEISPRPLPTRIP